MPSSSQENGFPFPVIISDDGQKSTYNLLGLTGNLVIYTTASYFGLRLVSKHRTDNK